MMKILIPVVVCTVLARTSSLSTSLNGKAMPRVAIVGAGMAGLSTARALSEHGVVDVDLFEAMDRIGGRIHPQAYYGGYLQHGAQFINGRENPIFRIADKLNVVGEIVGDYEHLMNATDLYGDCPLLTEKEIQVYREWSTPLDEKFRWIAANDPVASRRDSLYDAFQREYQIFIRKHKISGTRKDAFDAMALSTRSYFEFEWASDWKDQSLRNLVDFYDKGPIAESFNTDKIGYKAIIDYVAAGSGQTRLHFGSPVGNIEYGKPQGAYITLLNGTRIEQPYDYVVVTASLGHLKKYHKRLFTPALPPYKKKVIEKIGFGGSTKIFFRFAEPFWKPEVNSTLTYSIKGCNNHEEDPEQAKFESEVTSILPIKWEPNTVVMWIAGRGQRYFDNMSDEEVMGRLTIFLRRITQNATMPGPERIIRSRLTKNEYLLGSYSYISVAQARAKITHHQLSLPLKTNGRVRVMFAGEATHDAVFETAIGAFLSGRRDVDVLLTDWLLNGGGRSRRKGSTIE